MAAVDGRLQIRSYKDKDGNNRIAAEVVADNVRFLSPKSDDGEVDLAPPLDEIPW